MHENTRRFQARRKYAFLLESFILSDSTGALLYWLIHSNGSYLSGARVRMSSILLTVRHSGASLHAFVTPTSLFS